MHLTAGRFYLANSTLKRNTPRQDFSWRAVAQAFSEAVVQQARRAGHLFIRDAIKWGNERGRGALSRT